MSEAPVIRVATEADAGAIARVVNAAFAVEAFFKQGERTSAGQVCEMMRAGVFLVVDDAHGVPMACAYVSIRGETGYLGMLSVDPVAQGRGLGRLLTEAAESRCRAAGCRVAEIHVVNLREELPGFYRRLGFIETGATLPFPEDEETTRPCHFLVMTKSIVDPLIPEP